MEQAWLDSLSEDWVSQPRSSGSPAPSLPSLSNSTSDSSNALARSSRIPKYNPQKQSWTATHDGNNSPLSERSLNENNIPLSQRATRRPSKLRGEISNSTRGRLLSRTASASTTRSTQYHTIQHNKSVSLSPKKAIHETPEWKRRLLYGDVAYGEQRDLFSPAGLENIFRPPPPPEKSPARNFDEGSVAMPSSPPPYNNRREIHEAESEMSIEDQKMEENQHIQKPRVMKYTLADEGGSEFSPNDLSRSSSFQPIILTSRKEQHHDSFPDSVASSDFSAAQKGNNEARTGRTISGQSDFRNEELSPIYISRHNTVDGNIDYAALDLPAEELHQRLESLQVTDYRQSMDDAEDTSQALPIDMTVETDDYAHNGRFVNLRRGGHSQEGSFQKRMLSPSSLPAIDESAMLPEESMQASTPKQLPNIKKTRSSAEYEKSQEERITPPVPRTPHPSPMKYDGTDHKIHKSSSGSPLKIFGTYDTFTNQKLLRRLSQFEGDFEDTQDIQSASVQESTQPEINEAFVAASSPEKVSQKSQDQKHTSRKVSSFGEGELDNFQFSEEASYDSSRSNVDDEDKENISLPVLDPSTQTRFKFNLEPSPALEEEEEVMQRRTKYMSTKNTTKQIISVRKTVRPDTGGSGTSKALPTSQLVEDLETPRKRNGDSEGKRLRMSPSKDPTPKRRRTLHKTDIAQARANEEIVESDSLRETHQQMQSVIGRKRKDARHDDDQQAANPKVLAMRQILRPRTPTPSQRSSQHHERVPLAEVNLSSTERARLSQEEKIAKIQAELDSTNPLKASGALGTSQQMQDDSRKGSVTTQDFLDEAKKIMAGIRGKARPRSGLTSLEESESENDRNRSSATGTQDDELEESYQESTKEPFSRPPSRDGRPVPRMPLKQQDPELLDHLRKYEEMSDMDGVIASSIKSIAMAKEAANTAKEIDRVAQETISRASGRLLSQGDTVESEPPNIRISANPELLRKRKHSNSSVPPGADEHHEAEFPSQGSNGSSSQSTSRSIPTGSSRGSDSRGVIAPQSVSHLIPAQFAGMIFDHERTMWVKRKTVSGESGRSGEQNFLPSDETEDDPFGDIPDLSVDETQELQRIKAVAAKRKEEARVAHKNFNGKHQGILSCDESQRPANIAPSSGDMSPSEPSKLTRFASSGTIPETNTRLTSWGDEYAPISHLSQQMERSQEANGSQKYAQTKIREEVVEEVEREISIHEDRIDPKSPQRRRNITISFSSPLTSVIQPSEYADDSDFDGEEVGQSESDDHQENGERSVIITKRGSKQKSSSTSLHTTFRNASRRLSLGGHKFSARPVSRIDEQDEDSFDIGLDDRQRSISIVVAAPVPSKRANSLVLATPRPTHEIGTLSLTPLSDFTMNKGDESFGMEVSYVARGQRYVPGSTTKRTLSLSIKELVEKITEVEPYEPFWEHIKQMDLKDKKLTNLHKLDEFCEQLEDLDISSNQISQLNGAPRTLRHLRITHNYLSDLTAWGHLSNLQYIDVSNNEIESLSAFQCLVHLRGLRADNNKIKSLEGIGQLDGLLSLRLRGNMVDSLDFGGTKLQRLTDLDVMANKIRDVRNLQDLWSLSTLNLEDNNLYKFPSDDSELLWALKYLKLSGNNLESLDVNQYPNLRLLYLDRNRLGTITGLLKTKHLDSLSLREQQEGAFIDSSFLCEAFEVRKLFLSGNLLGTFKPQIDFLNLQYLELANCGLEALPVEFGQMVSNVRVLNLNFNALRDIKPLLGIVRLKKLHLSGNRLSRLRKTANVLAQFPTLTLADLRGNSLTLGFYPPVMDRSLVVHESAGNEESFVPEPFTVAKADRGKDEKYASRLDMDTRMLRRVYEILVLGGCPRLKLLDGLNVDMSILGIRDKVYEALIRANVLGGSLERSVSDGNQRGYNAEHEVVPESKPSEKPVLEERWYAEDSFA